MDYRNAYRGDESTGASCRTAALRHVKPVLPPPPPRPPRGVHFLGGLRCHSMERWIRKVAQPVGDADDSIFTLRSGAVCGVQEQERKGKGNVRLPKPERAKAGRERSQSQTRWKWSAAPAFSARPCSETETDVKPIPNLFDGAVENRTPCYTRGAGAGVRAANHVREPQLTSSLAPRPTCAPVTNDPNTS